jgi:hypothetical protein
MVPASRGAERSARRGEESVSTVDKKRENKAKLVESARDDAEGIRAKGV